MGGIERERRKKEKAAQAAARAGGGCMDDDEQAGPCHVRAGALLGEAAKCW